MVVFSKLVGLFICFMCTKISPKCENVHRGSTVMQKRHETGKKHRLSAPNNPCVQKLLNTELFCLNLSTTSEDDLVMELLSFESTYKVTYDNIENTILDIDI